MVCVKCEKKLAKLVTPDVKRLDGLRPNSAAAAGSSSTVKTATNTLLSKKNKNKFAPYEVRCKTCKARVSQTGSHYCQGWPLEQRQPVGPKQGEKPKEQQPELDPTSVDTKPVDQTPLLLDQKPVDPAEKPAEHRTSFLSSLIAAQTVASMTPPLPPIPAETPRRPSGFSAPLAPPAAAAPVKKAATAVQPTVYKPIDSAAADRFLQMGDELTLVSDHGGMMFADGQVKKRAYVLDNWAPRLASTGDQLKSVFRIEPQMAYREHKAYRQSIKHDVDDDLFYQDVLELPCIPKDGTDADQVEAFKQAAILEAHSNEMDFARLRGTTVIYGSIIQLFNMHTKSYLSVNSKETCYNEPTAMPLEMERNLKRECLFRIMPKFRIRADGEPVRVGDVVVFKSLATEAHLNHAKFKFHNDTAMLPITGANPTSDSKSPRSKLSIREACASMPQHGWTMKLFRTAQTAEFVPHIHSTHLNAATASATPSGSVVSSSAAATNRVVQGGKFVRLYHKERNGYLSTPTVMAMVEGGEVDQKVQLLEYHFDPLNPQDGSNCLSMWQVEVAGEAFCGEAVEWGCGVRLRHAASSLFLGVRREEEGEEEGGELVVDLVEVGEEGGEDATVFMFVKVNSEVGSAVEGGSYLRLRHVGTGAWLHPVRREEAGTRGVTAGGTSRNAFYFVASLECHMEDYFSVSLVDAESVDTFNHVHTCVPWIMNFVTQSRRVVDSRNGQYPIKSKEDRAFRMILSSLIYFCTKSQTLDVLKREGTPVLLHQSLLRETSIIDILLKFLVFPFNAQERVNLQCDLQDFTRSCTTDGTDSSDGGSSDSMLPNVPVRFMVSDGDGSNASPVMPTTRSGGRTQTRGSFGGSRKLGSATSSVDDISTNNSPRLSQDLKFKSNGSLNHDQASVILSEIKTGAQEVLVRLLRLVYRVLKQYLLGSEHANQSHVADKFMIFSQHIDLNIGAADTLMQLIDGNPIIVQKITSDQIESFITLLARDRNPSYVHFLIAMCYCDGVSMPMHQYTIAQKLLGTAAAVSVDESAIPVHLFRTKVEGDGICVFPATEKMYRAWVPLRELCMKQGPVAAPLLQPLRLGNSNAPELGRRRSMSLKRAANDAGRNVELKGMIPNRKQVAEYFESMLKLYKALCLGQNSKVIALLTESLKIVSLKECCVGMCDEELPDSIRGLYGDLVRVIFVDKYPITPPRSTYVFPIDAIATRPTFAFILGSIQNGTEETALLSNAAEWVETFLKSQSRQIAENAAKNQFVLSVLRLTKCLVQFGYIREEKQIKEMFRILMLVLDGKSDLRDSDMVGLVDDEREKTPWALKGRFEFNEQNQPIIHAKIEICLIMEQLIQLRLEMRAYLFLYYWHDYFRAGGKRVEHAGGMKDLALGFPNVHAMLSQIMDETAYFRLRDILSPILLELLRYESPKLKQCAIRLLHRMFSSIEELIEIAKTSVILNEPEHITSFQWIKNKIKVFTEHGVGTSAATDALGDVVFGGLDFHTAFQIKLLLVNLGDLCVLGSKTSGDSALDKVVKAPEGSVESDSIIQVEIRNLGIHNWVITMLKNRLAHAVAIAASKESEIGSRGRLAKPQSPGLRKGSDFGGSMDSLVDLSVSAEHSRESLSPPTPLKAVQSDLLLAAFEFLLRFCHCNKNHVTLLFDNFDLLIECTNPRLSGATPEVSVRCVEALGQMLSQNEETCLRLNESHIAQILELSHGSRPEYIRLLKSIVRSEGKVLKRNQSLAMKQLLENRKLYINVNVLLGRFADDLAEDARDERRHVEDLESDRGNSKASASGVPALMNFLDIRPSRNSVSRLNRGSRSASGSPVDAAESRRRDENVPLEYFEDVIFLLSDCCEERNYLNQLMCQTILSINEILSLMNSGDAPDRLKSALASLLVTTYMQATGEEDENEKHSERIQKDKRSWQFLEFVITLVKECRDSIASKRQRDSEREALLFGGALKFVDNFYRYCVTATKDDHARAAEISSSLLDSLTDLARLVDSKKEQADCVIQAIRAIADAGFEGNTNNGTEYDSWRVGSVESVHRRTRISCAHTGEYLEDHNVAGINRSLNDILQRISLHPDIKDMNAKEFTMLAQKFNFLSDKKLTPAEFAALYAPTRSIIEYLEQSASGIALQTVSTLKRRHRQRTPKAATATTEDIKYDVKTIKILEWLVTEEIASVDKIDRAKLPEKWAKAEHRKVEVQNVLDQLGCTLMAERLLTSERAGVFSSALRTLIVLLDGGNQGIQNSLETYWLGTREERFFYCVHETIKKFVIQVRETRMIQEAKLANETRDSASSSVKSSQTIRKSQSLTSIDSGDLAVSSLSNTRALNDNDSVSVAGSGGIEDGEYSVIRSVMRLLQLLVEGHNFRIQEYMRVQPDNVKTFNLIKQVVDFLHSIVSVESGQVVPVLIQAFDTLIDLSQGCTQNQVAIYQAKIVHAVNYIWVQNYSFCSKSQVLELKGKAALSLLSLLEDDADEETRSVFKQMATSIDLRALLENLNAVHKEVTEDEEAARRQVRERIKNMARKEAIVELGSYIYESGVQIGKDFMYELFGSRKQQRGVSVPVDGVNAARASDPRKLSALRDSVVSPVKNPDNSLVKQPLIMVTEQEVVSSPVGPAPILTDSMTGESGEKSRLLSAESHSHDRRSSTSSQHSAFADMMKKGEESEEEEESGGDDDDCSPKDTGFIYSMLIATLLPYMSTDNQDLCERNVAFNSFNNKTGRIEILRELNNATEKRLYTVLFPIPDVCFYIKDYTKERFLWMRKRNTPQEKVEDFINQSQDIIYEIKTQARVEENMWLNQLAKGHSYWWWGAYILSFFINIGNMLCMIAPTGDVEHDDFSKCPSLVDHGRTFLGLVMIVLWLLSFLEFTVTQLPLLVNRRRIQHLIDENAKISKENDTRLWKGGERVEMKSLSELQAVELTSNDLIRGFFFEPKALYHAAMVILAILGLQYPSLYAIHLLDFMYRDEVLQGVISSVTLNWSSLSKTVILGVIIIYIYSVLAFVYFRHAFDESAGLHCHSLFSCFLTVLSYGLRSGGGIGELLAVPVDESKEFYGARVLLDISFFLVVIVFLLNVVFGIIFDTFGQLREERKDISDDLRAQCYVCSINASEFQRHASGFEHHIKKEHNIWHYLFFLIHLELKDKTEYTSHETFISESLANNDLTFFPINRAIALKNREESDNVTDKIDALEHSLQLLMDSLNGVRMQLQTQAEIAAREAQSGAKGEMKASRMSVAVDAALAANRFKNLAKKATLPRK
ncbi:hypothetical protein HDU98_008929 [Podochytrium sp. JEL0797]|nr:hypothetical protein HDU98_008929 [Podochytrium sp. JEL0797]